MGRIRHASHLAAACALLAPGLGGPASGGAAPTDHICKPIKATKSDLAWLRKTANEVAAGRKLDWSTSVPCGSYKHATSIIDAVPVKQPDGAETHGATWCERDAVKWECKWVQFRLLTVQVRTAGGPRPALLRLEGDFDAALGTELVQNAVDLGPALTTRQECGSNFAPQVEATEESRLALETLRKYLLFEDPELVARIDDFPSNYTVEINNSYLAYRPGSADPVRFEFECWGPERWLRMH